jgi:hypothetical protein
METRRTVMGRHGGKGSSSRGFIRFKVLLTLAVVAGLVYCGIKLGPPYWNYLSMYDPVKEAAMAVSRRTPEAEVRAGLIARARATDVALEDEDIEILQRGNFLVVRVSWEVPLDVPMYRRTLRFEIEQAVPAP